MESKNKRYIVVKFSELSLKGGNKKEFVSTLIKTINRKIEAKKIEAKVLNKRDKLEIISENDIDKIPSVLKYIVGISSYSFVYETEINKLEIEKELRKQLSIYPKGTFFRISVKLIDKTFFESKEKIIEWLAWFGTEELKFKINLKRYEIDINIRFENKKATIFFGKSDGIIGLPSGANGKALTLLSGGIDSPVAGYKIISRGINTSFVTFLTSKTFSDTLLNKIKSLASKVNEYNGIPQKLFIVKFDRVQLEIMKLEDETYRIILLRRYFMRLAELLSKKYGYKFLITGDSLGQVASQTPESMTEINKSIDKLIIRPLVSMSKNEIIKIAEHIETYKISIGPGDDMCSLFTPKNPIIFPKEKKIIELENKLKDMESVLFKVFDEDMRIIDL